MNSDESPAGGPGRPGAFDLVAWFCASHGLHGRPCACPADEVVSMWVGSGDTEQFGTVRDEHFARLLGKAIGPGSYVVESGASTTHVPRPRVEALALADYYLQCGQAVRISPAASAAPELGGHHA